MNVRAEIHPAVDAELLPPAERARRWLQVAGERLPHYAALIRLDRPAGALLLLWPTLWALWIACAGTPSAHLLLVFVGGVWLMRSAGCVVNDVADREFDPHVERTRGRPLATGAVRPGEALRVAAALLLLAFVLVLTTNRLTVLLSFAAVPLALVYPYMKRVTYVPQFFLGLAFSWGIPMAFAAAGNAVPLSAWLLFIANVLWAMIYDTIYAMVDRDDDLRIGVRSTAILFAEADRAIIGIMQGMLLLAFVIIGRQLGFGMHYYGGIALAALLMAWHQFLIRERARDGCLRAFRSNNWLGLAVLGGIVLEYAAGSA